ncbi:Protein phosphatase Slingshot like 1 [Dissostichus eleginoides]|uniref:Protein phosphatase Slingshot homolog 1 n=1 Tax=Dissostichus eleginoides TaxID=100907 RepID=A0AAD9F8I7_DISEL|nr:Protein phosphatase Slingshot like 1 [Dissostichus eleginoides]
MHLKVEHMHEAVMKMLPYFVENAVLTQSEINRILSESYFMVKGAALFLQQGSSNEGQKAHPHHKHAGDLPQHLQVMINILRSEDRIKLAVRLETAWSDRVRYMVVVYTSGRQDTEENIMLGIDFTSKDSKSCSIGMALPLWSDTKIHLDGDGGFTVNTATRTHVFKPVSVQAMWSALQVLHKACEVSRRYNYFPGGMALTWMGYYESCIASEQSCINEWNAMKDLEITRPDSPTMFVEKPSERERTGCLIKAKLRSIMMCRDLENITCKEIRTELEQHMNCNLKEYKEFIDNEMLLILGQMDKPTLIFDHVYLGSEWNASNLEELQESGVGYILNITREIDNFFPGTFSYHNIRVYDEDATDLLAHWNETYNFIVKAKKNHSKCLVHCKMGVSRSASSVIAYAMKEFGWSLEKAYNFVKQKRSITRPNAGFMRQLAEYEGILDASKQRHNKLWHPNADCEMSEGQQGLSQCCGGEGGHLTPEPGMSPCCEEALSDKGAACPSPRRAVALEVDPAYNNYYFRRLSDSALDSEPSTPVRGPPLIGMEKVFIEIDDVERDALLDDEAFDSREGLPLPPVGPTADGTAAQTSSRGPEALEELRLRLEFSTPLNGKASSHHTLSWSDSKSKLKEDSPPLVSKLCLNPSPPEVPSASFPLSHTSSEGHLKPSLKSSVGLLRPCGPRCDCANCAAPPPAALLHTDEQHLAEPKGNSDIIKVKNESQKGIYAAASEAVPELMTLDLEEEKLAVALCVGHQQETLLQLQRSGLVRRRAERLERLSGLSNESSLSLKPLHTCHMSGSSPFHTEGEEEFSGFPKTSTPCHVRLEPLVVPLSNEALLGVVGSGLLTPTSSPHGSTLTRSSSSDSLRSVRGKPGLVRQRAQEIETRMRTLLLLSLSPEPDPSLQWDPPSTPALPRPRKDLHTPERSLPVEPRS